MYGPGDNFDLESSHVLPALIRKFHASKVQGEETVSLWGTGAPTREFLHADDMGRACIFLLENYDDDIAINVGVGQDVSIRELAELIQEIVGFHGNILWDTSKPDGTPRRLLDISKIQELGWRPTIALEEGVKTTYEWYLSQEISGDVSRQRT
jgi:GDP-L-fucose synthase